MNPAIWNDVRRDLPMAAKFADQAAGRDASLREHGAGMDPEARVDREYAIGVMLHNCYGALESALERLVKAFDGDVPNGRSYQADLVRRAANRLEGSRPAIIAGDTAALLHRLRGFRHAFRNAYLEYDYVRAAENVPLAAAATAQVRADIERFAGATGFSAG